MKTIGLIGGMSWESTAEYYRIMNEAVNERLGKLHSAKILLYSFDFEELVAPMDAGDWDHLAARLSEVARVLEAAGADCMLIGTNTMHKVADAVASAVSVPLLHIVDAAAARIEAEGLRRVGLLGTRFTMEDAFYRDRLKGEYGLEVLIPQETERQFVHQVIFNELCRGVVKEFSRKQFGRIVHNLKAAGAEGIILGCTEIPMLLQAEESEVPLFDTTVLHAMAAVDFALGD